MIIFQNPSQFLQRLEYCQECGSNYQLGFLSGSKTNNFLLFSNKTCSLSLEERVKGFDWSYQSPWEKIIHTSHPEDHFVHYLSFNRECVITKHFTLNVKTGILEGNLNDIQEVFWNHKLVIGKYCDSEKCGHNYFAQSEGLFLERNAPKIFPFKLHIEGYLSKINNELYCLTNDYYFHNEARLSKYIDETMQHTKYICSFPHVNMIAFKNKNAVSNKIKTILSFL